MDVDLNAALERFNAFYGHLSAETVDGFRELAAPNVRYCDPFTDVQGVDAVVAELHKWFTALDDLEYEGLGYARNGLLVFAHWRMAFRLKQAPARGYEIDAVSTITFDADGKVLEQVDYWDPSPILTSIPLLGRAVALARKLAAG